MITPPQTSVAVATPVAFVRVSPGHSITRSAGIVSAGGVVSRTLILWMQLAALPHGSVPVQVREMIRVSPHKGAMASAYVTRGVPQVSVALAAPVADGNVLVPHSTVTLSGHVMTGGVVSRTVMVCTQVDALPHGSVARQVREMT